MKILMYLLGRLWDRALLSTQYVRLTEVCVTRYGVTRMLYTGIMFLALMGVVSGCTNDSGNAALESVSRTVEQRSATQFSPAQHFDAPIPQQIPIPSRDGVDAIWGATGRDAQGRIYFGASSHGARERTAYLYQYDPETGVLTAQGDVLSEVRRAGLYQAGLGQNKLHSKIYQAPDGFLYFSSFDEQGETDTQPPFWGGHLWRKKPEDKHWEHLLATPEALIAVNSTGPLVYALGYWGHVLYQFDTLSRNVKRQEVGSVPGHISRNFLVDLNQHAYVPSVVTESDGAVVAYLHEYDRELNLVQSAALPGYVSDKMRKNQGILSYAMLRDGTLAFVAGEGELYTLSPDGSGRSELTHRGKIHPEGEASVKSLFTFDGDSLLVSVGRLPGRKSPWQWIIYELESGVATAKPLDLDSADFRHLYGSVTKDASGSFYVGGVVRPGGSKPKPALLRMR